jgi:hypothetical protein
MFGSPFMKCVLAAIQVPDQERQYYAGPVRKISGRMALQVTSLRDHATTFNTREAAEEVCKELGVGWNVVEVDDGA